MMYDVLVYAVVTTLKKIKVKHGADGGSRTHRTQGLSLLYMPILLLPHIPSAATETIPLFLLDLHFAGKFEVVN